MTPSNVLLIGLALLAMLFFTGGLIDFFNDLRADSRQRRRRRKQEPLLTEVPALTASLVAPSPAAVELAPPALPQAPLDLPATETSRESAGSSHVEGFPHDEAERTKIVVHYRNGRVIKGYSYDFYPNKPHFHLLPPVAGFSFTDEAVEVRVEELKAVFFVKDFAGNPSYNERRYFAPDARPPGRKVAVKFSDGETLVGSTVGYEPQRPGFFLIPADPRSNNLRVFVVAKAITAFRFL